MVGWLVNRSLLALTLVAAVVSVQGLTADLGVRSSTLAAYADHCAVRPATGARLSTGSHGDQVWILQTGLTNAGHSSGYLDGNFGPPERDAVIRFQQSRGLAATGIADDATWNALAPYIDASQTRFGAAQPSYGQTSATFNAAGFNALFPGQPYFGLQAMSTRAGGAPSPPYIPPTLSKSIGWIESSWRQVHGSAAPLISSDCGYGIAQITYPGVPLPGADGNMISWGMKDRAPEPIYSNVQVPITTSFTHNIAFGGKTLIAKWNGTPWVLDGNNVQNPGLMESWYYAVWAYNGFASSNNPLNREPLRGEYSCNPADGFNHDRSKFPYQELVFGCVKHPPKAEGVALWPPLDVSLPPSSSFLNCPPGCPNISVPQPVHVDPTSGTFPAPVTIDTRSGAQTQPFTLSGWAVDYAAQRGTGVDAVHVYAFPADASGNIIGAPSFGVAAYGFSRGDVATAFGNPGFANSGYALEIRGLAPGYYQLAVYARSSVTKTPLGQDIWNSSNILVSVQNAPRMALDSPAGNGEVGQPFTLSGWAIDRAAGAGTGVDAVHVYAYPSDASGTPIGGQTFSAAAYGAPRPDVAAAFGPQFANSGYTLKINGLGAGHYRLVVYARNVLTGQWHPVDRVIFVPPPAIAVDAPAPDATVQEPFGVSGWAIDRAAAQSAGVDAVHVYAYPKNGGPAIFLGVAQHGLSRPDIAGLFGQRFAASGYALKASGLPAGVYDLVVYARSTITGSWQASQRPIVVPSPAMAIDAPSPNSQVEQPFPVTGWAIDRATAQGSGVDAVHVYAYPAAGGAPVFLGAASTGLSRPDIGGLFGPQFAASGYALSASGLPAGQYVLAVYARSTVTGIWQHLDRQVLVQ